MSKDRETTYLSGYCAYPSGEGHPNCRGVVVGAQGQRWYCHCAQCHEPCPGDCAFHGGPQGDSKARSTLVGVETPDAPSEEPRGPLTGQDEAVPSITTLPPPAEERRTTLTDAAAVREWARGKGIKVGDRGRLPRSLVQQWGEETQHG